jgi:hypothetical protein
LEGEPGDIRVGARPGHDQLLALERSKMAIEPEGWHIDANPPSWDPDAKAFSFFLHKPGHQRVLCILSIDALENAVQSSVLSGPALTRIFDAHRQMIELRAAQKLNAGLLESRPLRAGRR